MKTVLACCLSLALPALAHAFQPGDLVAVVQSAPIHSGGKIVGTVAPGNTLVVGRVGDEGLWVNFKAAGWIDPTHVVPLADAEGLFGDRLKKNRDDAEAHYGHARSKMAHEKWTDAILSLNEAARLDPKRSEFFITRGHVLTRQRRYDEALADFNYAIQIDPLNAQVTPHSRVFSIGVIPRGECGSAGTVLVLCRHFLTNSERSLRRQILDPSLTVPRLGRVR